ncbi:hypothetical protein NJ7G_0563 [Natrinema sp. J7-2]|nr:hypothetical protein NJ7G_0563 [Natrinema sp. J7-2]
MDVRSHSTRRRVRELRRGLPESGGLEAESGSVRTRLAGLKHEDETGGLMSRVRDGNDRMQPSCWLHERVDTPPAAKTATRDSSSSLVHA